MVDSVEHDDKKSSVLDSILVKHLKELQVLLKMCRKYGVDKIQVQGIFVEFGAAPSKKEGETVSDDEEIQTDELTFDQLAFLSAPLPGG